jgi:hypothetical protein
MSSRTSFEIPGGAAAFVRRERVAVAMVEPSIRSASRQIERAHSTPREEKGETTKEKGGACASSDAENWGLRTENRELRTL